MKEKFNHRNRIPELDSFLKSWFGKKNILNPTLKEAMLYSLFNGGKRIRPLLFYTLLEDLDRKEEADHYFASALECIHTYSLIHDDLPAMDDDDYRRGQMTCHKKFGEAFGILAGDGLLNESMELVLEGIGHLNDEEKYKGLMAAKFLFRASGNQGMIDGQAMDISQGAASENLALYKKKTGALIGASLAMASALAKGDLIEAEIFYSIGLLLGVSYQLQDDRFDIIEDGVCLAEKDHMEKLEDKSVSYVEKVYSELDGLGLELDNLKDLVKDVLDRKE